MLQNYTSGCENYPRYAFFTLLNTVYVCIRQQLSQSNFHQDLYPYYILPLIKTMHSENVAQHRSSLSPYILDGIHISRPVFFLVILVLKLTSNIPFTFFLIYP